MQKKIPESPSGLRQVVERRLFAETEKRAEEHDHAPPTLPRRVQPTGGRHLPQRQNRLEGSAPMDGEKQRPRDEQILRPHQTS